MAQLLLDLVTSFGNCLSCFPGSPTLKINNRSFKILRLLGEGGFSYVYLVEDTSTQAQYALKKIRCPFGAESVAQAMREVDAYRLFGRTPGIIHAVDHAVASERGGGGDDPGAKTVYVLLPYYKRGNLQDLINANAVNNATFPERRLMLLFLGAQAAAAAAAAAAGGEAAAGAGAGSGHVVISESIRDVVRRCLTVEPAERPDIDELIAMVEKVIDELPGDGEA
ncbi:Nucleoporin [Verticillium dahliae VDG2]|nr:Nucleoporin [Verticillium dahliae VDG2]